MKNSLPVPELKMTKFWFVLTLFVLLAYGILSLIPTGPDMGDSDKLAHFLAYAILSAWLSLLVKQRKSLWYILFGLIGYGLFLEFLQSLISYRVGDLVDAVANGLGVITGLFIYFSPLRRVFRQVDNWLLSWKKG